MVTENQKFEVKGTFLMGDEWAHYTKVIEAPNAKLAEERTFALIGSKHNLKRRYIKIDGITLVNGK